LLVLTPSTTGADTEALVGALRQAATENQLLRQQLEPQDDLRAHPVFDKALNVTLNSVVFGSSGQDLTTTATYTEMTSRFLEPTLLALAVLAIRGCIKR
jgi:hypothetical protein